jgi:type I restriction enzyme M protein
VERPLRLKVALEPEKVKRITFAQTEPIGGMLVEQQQLLKTFKFKDEDQFQSVAMWLSLNIGKIWMERDDFLSDLMCAMKSADVKLSAPTVKALLSYFGETDPEAEICRDAKGRPEPDPKLRDHELVPLDQDWRDYVQREVIPFVPDAWVDESYRDDRDGGVGRVGYEINFNRYFYKYVPPRPLAEIDAELKALEAEIAGLLKEVVE